MRKELYISDLDGTLVQDGKNLSEYVVTKLSKIIDNCKKEFVISSARNYESIKTRIIGLNKNIKIVSRNGSVIHDENSNVIHSVKMKREDILKAIEYSVNKSLCPVIIKLIGNKEEIYCISKHLNSEFEIISRNMEVNYIDRLDMFEFDNIIGIYSFGNIEKDYDYEICNLKVRKDKGFIQITSINADKGEALKFLKEKYDYESITAFGNDENDYLMLDYSDIPYYIYSKESERIDKYNNIVFDDGKRICAIIQGGKNEDINDT